MKDKLYGFGLFIFIVLLGPASLPAEEVQDTTTHDSESQAEARAILMEMADFLSNTGSFSVNILSAHDAVQPDGQKIEFAEIRNITVNRPDHMRIEVERSDGEQNLVLYNGRDITVNSLTHNLYAQAEIPGGIDTAVAYFIQELHMHLPLALLLVSSLGTELEKRLQSVDYVESTNILGVPAHHLAARTETVDFQVWVTANDQPLPLRVVLTYRNAAGQPQYRAQFSGWNLAPPINSAMFEFTPLNEAKKISFLTQLKNVAVQRDEAIEQTGEQP